MSTNYRGLNREDYIKHYSLTKPEIEELINIIENGPIDQGSTIGSRTCGALLQKGLAIRFQSLLHDGQNIVATPDGGLLYRVLFGSALDNADHADTIAEAHQNRLAQEAIERAKKL